MQVRNHGWLRYCPLEAFRAQSDDMGGRREAAPLLDEDAEWKSRGLVNWGLDKKSPATRRGAQSSRLAGGNQQIHLAPPCGRRMAAALNAHLGGSCKRGKTRGSWKRASPAPTAAIRMPGIAVQISHSPTSRRIGRAQC
jgi:hypothetical protein